MRDPTSLAPGRAIAFGVVTGVRGPVDAKHETDWPGLCAMVASHSIGETKDGAGWLPGPIEPGPRTGGRMTRWDVLALDVEAHAERIAGTDTKRLTGPKPPTVFELATELEVRGWAAAIVTSFSHEAVADEGTLGPRYRVVLNLSRPLQPDEIKPAGMAVARLLGIADCFDSGCLEPGRLFYLPRVPESRVALAQSAVLDGVPLDVDCVLKQARQADARPTRKSGAAGGSVIDSFNARADIGALLEQHGYSREGCNRWTWPGSTTGMPGVVLLPDTGRIYSHHPGDPLAGEHSHDAFGAWCALEYGGDYRAAVKEAARMLGMQPERGQGSKPHDAATAPAAWLEPTPLPEALLPVQPFDAELLPEALRAWVMDIADRMQCPPDFAAVGAVTALSSLIGARVVVQPKERDDWQVVANLWAAIVGRPGVFKSPALNEALKPLHRLEANERERWQAEHDAWEIDCKLGELQGADREKQAKAIVGKNPAKARELLEPGDVPQEPVARRYIVNDSTVERLGELLTENPWGTLSYRDELYGLLTGMDRQGQEGSRAFYLQAFDGDKGYTFDRIIRGTTYIPRVCLSMIGGIQPGRIHQYVRDAVAGGSGDDGLLQRFALTVWPDISGEFVNVDRWPDTVAKQTAWDVFERLAGLQPASETEPAVWRFDAAAQALFNEWRIGFEQELKRGELHPAMESHLAKYRKLVPALALIFALVDTPVSGGLIGAQELTRALAWSEYLRTHAERLYAAAATPETASAKSLLQKLRGGKLNDADGVIADSFTPRQVAVKSWAGLGTPEAVRKAADVLAEYDWLRREVVPSSDAMGRGRPSERYLVNPALIGGAS